MDIRFRNDRLRQRRRVCGYTQQSLADALQYTYDSVCNWERGKRQPHIHALAQLALVLGVSMEWLMNGSETP